MANPTNLKYTKDHIWVKVDGDTALIGVTDYAQEQFGDILFVDLPEVGAKFDAGDAFTEIESSKTATEANIPFACEIVEVNEDLDDSPEAINEGAYDAWIIKVKINDVSELDALLDAAAYEAAL